MSWSTEKLGNLLAPSGYDRGESNDYPVLSITMHDGLVDQSTKFKKRIASRDTANYRVVYTNELVVGFPIDEGVLGFQTKYPAAIVSPAYGIWKLTRPKESHIPYLEGYLRSDVAREIYASKMRGGVARRRTISKEAFLDIEIPFPPLDEQRRIAAVLNIADTLSSQRQESLQLTEKLLQSVFIDMFGDPVTNPKGFRMKSLKDWGRVSTGTTPKSSKDGMFGGAIPFVTPGDLKETWIQTVRTVTAEGAENSRTVRKGATLVCCIGATIGKMGKAARTSAFNQQVNAIEWYDDVLDDYGLEAMRFLKKTIIQNGSAATLPILNKSAFQSLELPVAPIEEQKRFVEIVRLLESIKKDAQEAADESGKMFYALQQGAFRGELDLSKVKLGPEEPKPAEIAAKLVETVDGIFHRPGYFPTPPELEAEMMDLESKLDRGHPDSIPWNENYFKYRILSQVLRAPFTFQEIWEQVEYDIDEPDYDTVKDKVFEYVEQGLLEQRFDEETKRIVFWPPL
jgi:type I restriction enzyme S subunit